MLDLRAQFKGIERQAFAALKRVMASQQFVLGPEGEGLEREMARYCGVKFGVGVASGTDALELALRGCDVQAGDEVIVPAFTFIATAGAVSAIGAKPVFADIDPLTMNIDPASVEQHVTSRTAAIVAVHLYGLPADLQALGKIARKHDLALVEDNAQSLGAAYHGKKLGAFADAAATSFYPSKNLGGCGDGGMLLTDSQELAARVATLRNHGQTGRYLSFEIGVNSRLDELQAAVLRIKLRRLDGWIAARQAHAGRYDRRLRAVTGLTVPATPIGSRHSYYLYTVRISSDGSNPAERRDHVAAELQRQGMGCGVYYPVPLHLQPLYETLGGKVGDLPASELASHEVLSLPLYPEMTAAHVVRVADAVKRALEKT